MVSHLLMSMSRWNPSTHHLLILIMMSPGSDSQYEPVCVFITFYKAVRVGGGGYVRTCAYERRRAEACVD
jgi:hypothetical protein